MGTTAQTTRDTAGARVASVPTPSSGTSLGRRSVLAGLAAGMPMIGMPTRARATIRPDPAQADWASFKRRFLAPEGRVVDTGNNGVSHSEGQGIGMLAAVRFDDRETFNKMAAWTNAHLVRATDRLYSWRYKPGLAMPVDDPNNATDGDMLIAWAMFEAARKWDDPVYRSAGYQIANDIRLSLVRPMGDRLVLLPGTYGFAKEDRTVLNPSYYIFPALHRFATEMPHPTWTRLWHDSVAMMRETRYGPFGLPSDWVSLEPGQATPRMADGWPPRFSWDAVRVPLYMAWAGLEKEPAVEGAVRFWESYGHGQVPAWTDLRSGGVAPYGQNCGLRAVQAFATAAHRGHDCAVPSSCEAPDYYAAALTMLVHVAKATREQYSAPIA